MAQELLGWLLMGSLRCGSGQSCYTPKEINTRAFRKLMQDEAVFWSWERLSRVADKDRPAFSHGQQLSGNHKDQAQC